MNKHFFLVNTMVRNQLNEIGVELTRAKRQVGTLIKVLETEIVLDIISEHYDLKKS